MPDVRERKDNQSLVDHVREQIVAMINIRGLMGSDDISEARLAESLGVSRTPVRAALARLESEGLLQAVHGRGWTVLPLTPKDVQEIFDLEEALQSLAVRQAAEKGTPDEAADLAQVMNEMEEMAPAGNLEKWIALDNRFHELVHHMADNRRLWRATAQNDALWFRYRPAYQVLHGGQIDRLCQEHRLIGNAIIARQPDLAVEHMVNHLRQIRQDILTVMETVLAPLLSEQGWLRK